MPRPAKLPIVRFLNSIWLLNWSTAVIWCFPINAVGKCSKLDTNQLKWWCCFINFVFQADLHGLSFLTLRDGPPTVTDRTDQEFSGPIGSKLHLRRLHPTNYICTKYFSAFLRSLAIFLAFWHFPQYFPSPFHCSCLKSKSVSIFPTWLFPKQRLTQELVKYGSLSNGAMDQEGWLRFSTSFFTKLPRQSHWNLKEPDIFSSDVRLWKISQIPMRMTMMTMLHWQRVWPLWGWDL